MGLNSASRLPNNRARASSVLIVEDESLVARDLQETLSEFGYDAFSIASSADEAIACASRRCPDIVLMDISIKGTRDGIEAARILKGEFDTPVIYLTAHSDESTLSRAKKTDPHGYLIKPVNPAELRSTIEVALLRHAVEARLRESERWHSTALHSIADAVLTVDVAGIVTFMNSAAELLIARSATAVVGHPVCEVMRLAAPDAEVETPVPLEVLLRSGQVMRIKEGPLPETPDSRLVFIDSVAPMLDGGRIVGAVMLLRDASQRRRLEDQLEFSDRLVSLGTMAATTAHEINNTLCVVTADTSYIGGEIRKIHEDLNEPGATQRAAGRLEAIAEVVEEIQSATSRIETIVADLRTQSRPIAATAEAADLRRCVDWALRVTSQEFHNRARVFTRLFDTPLARGDEARIGQVLINLLKNSAQSIEPGSIERNAVTLATRVNAEGNPVIEVSDTGSGIPPHVRQRIFEPFFTTKPAGIGTGLGLPVCQGIVNSIGGRIELESEVGKGTTFRVILSAAGHSSDYFPPP